MKSAVEMSFDEIVGKSAALRTLLQQVEVVAPTGSTVLICGETGTGKGTNWSPAQIHNP